MSRDYRKLESFHLAHQQTIDVYAATQSFPVDEKFGLTSQLRRAAASVPTNIVEGCARESQAELAQFLNISLGSASELHYLLLLARDVGLAVNEALIDQAEHVARAVYNLQQKIRADLAAAGKART
jgi:four helix bundle protein